MDLAVLNRTLTVDEIDFRVDQVKKSGDSVWASILAYKDARVDMKVLDEAVGQLNWQCTYQRDSKDVLQCSIGIWDESKNMGAGGWVVKTSNGTPSNFESEKGEYSDAFKRAGFMWGIGRKLYDFPPIRVQLNEKDYYETSGKVTTNWNFRPNDWKWEASDDYKTVTAKRKYNGKLVEVYNSNPYKK